MSEWARPGCHSAGEAVTATLREVNAALAAVADADKGGVFSPRFLQGPARASMARVTASWASRCRPCGELVRQYRTLDLKTCERLLASPYNEARLLALLILVAKYGKWRRCRGAGRSASCSWPTSTRVN